MLVASGLLFAALVLFQGCDHVVLADGEYSNYTLLRITPTTDEQVGQVNELSGKHGLDLWTHPKKDRPTLTHVAPDKIKDVEDDLTKLGIKYSEASQDVESLIAAQKAGPAGSFGIANHGFSTDKYNRLEDIEKQFQEWADQYPDRMKLIRYGKSGEGRNLTMAVVSKSNPGSNEGKRIVMLECGMHSREWVSQASCLKILEWLLTDPKRSQALDTFDFHILSVSNPDGYEFSWTRNRMWRKTRSKSRRSGLRARLCRGGDPNRNFDAGFGGASTSKDPCSDIYPGDKVWSEPESRNLRDYIWELTNQGGKGGDNPVEAYFCIHNYMQMWMYPYGYKTDKPENEKELNEMSRRAVEALKEPYGTEYTYGTISETVYPASGSSADWVYEKAGVPYSFAIELRDKGQYGFLLPPDQIVPTAEELWLGIESVLKDIDGSS